MSMECSSQRREYNRIVSFGTATFHSRMYSLSFRDASKLWPHCELPTYATGPAYVLTSGAVKDLLRMTQNTTILPVLSLSVERL